MTLRISTNVPTGAVICATEGCWNPPKFHIADDQNGIGSYFCHSCADKIIQGGFGSPQQAGGVQEIDDAPRPADYVEAPSDSTGLTIISMTYRNHRGEFARRTIIPRRLWWGSTEWHPEPGWMLTADDVEKWAERDFRLSECDFGSHLLLAPDEIIEGRE